MLDTLYEQLSFVQSHLEDLDFRNFSMETRFAKEDEAAAKADEDRQKGWLEEVGGDIEAITQEMEELKETDGTISAENQPDYNALEQELTALNNEKGDLEGQIADF